MWSRKNEITWIDLCIIKGYFVGLLLFVNGLAYICKLEGLEQHYG